jgi:hypothetical protein
MASRAEQYTLHAYVCGNACLQTPDVDGTVSFSMIYVKRPDNCRYAIVSRYDVDRHDDEVMVWDLFDAWENIRTGDITPPEPVRRAASVDAAIMATFLLYDEEAK